MLDSICWKNPCTLLVGSDRRIRMVNGDLSANVESTGLFLLKKVTFVALTTTEVDKDNFFPRDLEFLVSRQNYFCYCCLSQQCLKVFNIKF